MAEGNLIYTTRNSVRDQTWLNPDPPPDHDGCILIRADEGTKGLVRRNIPPFQEVAVWPLEVVIQEDVSHQALELIDRKEPTRAAEEVSSLVYRVPNEGRMEPPGTDHACLPWPKRRCCGLVVAI